MEYIKEGHMTRYRKGAFKDSEQFVFCKLKCHGPGERPEIHGFTDASSPSPNFVLKVKSFAGVTQTDLEVPKIVKAKYENYICIRAKGTGGAMTYLAADNREQRDEWCALLRSFFDRKAPNHNSRGRLHTDTTFNRPTPSRGRKTGAILTAPATAIGTFHEELAKVVQRQADTAQDDKADEDSLCCPRHHLDSATSPTENLYENVHLVNDLEKWRQERLHTKSVLQKQSTLYKDLHQLTNLQTHTEDGIEGAYGDSVGVNRWSSSSSSSDEGPLPLRSTDEFAPVRIPCESSWPPSEDDHIPNYSPPSPPVSRERRKSEDLIPVPLPVKRVVTTGRRSSEPDTSLCARRMQETGCQQGGATLEEEAGIYVNSDIVRRTSSTSRPSLPEKKGGVKSARTTPSLPELPPRNKPPRENQRKSKPLPAVPTKAPSFMGSRPLPLAPIGPLGGPEIPPMGSRPLPPPPIGPFDRLEKLKGERFQGNAQVKIPKAIFLRSINNKGLLLRETHDEILVTRVPKEMSDFLRVGDQLVKINHQLLNSVSYAHDCISLSDETEVTVVVVRIPSATICNFRWTSDDLRDIGLELEGRRITSVNPHGVVVREGNLQSRATNSMMTPGIRCNHIITEINYQSVDPDATTKQVHQMLKRAGRDIVLILHPEDFSHLQVYPDDEDFYEPVGQG